MDMHISDQLLAYIEGRLTPETRTQVEAHLTECADCRAELDARRGLATELVNARRTLSRLPTRARWETVRAQMRAQTRAQLRLPLRTPSPLRLWRFRFGWQVAASMAVVLAVLTSNLALSGVRAETPSVPFIQTPAAHVVTADTATAQATRPLLHRDSTFTPTLTPGP